MNKCYCCCCSLKGVCFSPLSLSESGFLLIVTACFFGAMMANNYLNVYIIARDKMFYPCKSTGLSSKAPYPSRHRPVLLYTEASRRPYDVWPRNVKHRPVPRRIQNCRWFENCWNRSAPVLFTTLAKRKHMEGKCNPETHN